LWVKEIVGMGQGPVLYLRGRTAMRRARQASSSRG